jgi:hypothetical protein
MKYILLLSMVLPSIVFGQTAGVVTDPGAYSYLAKSAVQAAETGAQIKKQIDILEQARDAIEKVNNALRDLILVDDILENQAYIIKYSSDAYRRFEQSGQFTPGELANILISFNYIVAASANNIKLANALLKDNLLKMSDADRLEKLQKISNEMRTTASDIQLMENRFNTILQRKYLKKAFGN